MSWQLIEQIARGPFKRSQPQLHAFNQEFPSGFCRRNASQAGRIAAIQEGAFYMAKDAGVPVVPIAIRHSDVLMGKGTGEARSGTLEIVIMPRFRLSGVSTDQDVNDLIAQARQGIARELGVEISV